MSDHPVEISRSITLITDEKLDKSLVMEWFKTIRNLTPSGILIQHQTANGSLQNVALVYRQEAGKNLYIIPISRDLMDNEVRKLVEASAHVLDGIDFDLDVSQVSTEQQKESAPLAIDDQKYVELCSTWARRQHEQWMKDRQESGWTYGATVSFSNKTHPLLVQWDQLPDKFKSPDLDQPQMLLDLLNDQGYAVVRKEELDAIRNLMRRL